MNSPQTMMKTMEATVAMPLRSNGMTMRRKIWALPAPSRAAASYRLLGTARAKGRSSRMENGSTSAVSATTSPVTEPSRCQRASTPYSGITVIGWGTFGNTSRMVSTTAITLPHPGEVRRVSAYAAGTPTTVTAAVAMAAMRRERSTDPVAVPMTVRNVASVGAKIRASGAVRLWLSDLNASMTIHSSGTRYVTVRMTFTMPERTRGGGPTWAPG